MSHYKNANVNTVELGFHMPELKHFGPPTASDRQNVVYIFWHFGTGL